MVPQRTRYDYPEFDVDDDDKHPFIAEDTVELIAPFDAACRGVTKSYSGHKLSLLSSRPTAICISALERLRRSTATMEDCITCSPDRKSNEESLKNLADAFMLFLDPAIKMRIVHNSRGHVMLHGPGKVLSNQELRSNFSDLHYCVTRPSLRVVLRN